MIALFQHLLAACLSAHLVKASAAPIVVDERQEITYRGLRRNGIELFLNIPYGQNTNGLNRFKPPNLFIPEKGATIEATAYGPACPQPLGAWVPPLSLTNVTHISEDCLNLNIARPKDVVPGNNLPVMVYIHGGGFWVGQNQDLTIVPDGMILESVKNGLPILHVAMNYRLGLFGFAQSGALQLEGSENAGLRDQRLALEWVQNNIHHFGGDPRKVTIFGQSSGGLSVGMQIMAYGGSRPVPFHQGICESQSLEPGITGKFTIGAMQALVESVGCNSSHLDSTDTVKCLRNLDMNTLLNASIETYTSDIAHNIGDVWLPVVDGDFLPAPPSQLIREHRFANVTAIVGWCQDDVAFFTDYNIKTANDTLEFITAYVPDLSRRNVEKLLSLYPISEFSSNEEANLSAEFYRTARVFRDILMTCPPIAYAEQISAAGNDVYLYNWNQTILGPILSESNKQSGLGVIHTSEFAYIFGNLSHYDTDGYPFNPTTADYEMEKRGTRSWSTFASTGKPGLRGHDTFQNFGVAFPGNDQILLFVAGGPNEGISAIDGCKSHPAIKEQDLRNRCALINSQEFIEQLRY